MVILDTANTFVMFFGNCSDMTSIMDWACDSFRNHCCAFYHTEAAQFDSAVDYLGAALRSESKVIYACGERESAAILLALERKGHQPMNALGCGKLVILQADAIYLVDGDFDVDRMIAVWTQEIKKALDEGFDGVCAVGTTEWIRQHGIDPKIFVAYEKRVNELFADGKIRTLCQYLHSDFSESAARGMVEAHPSILLGGGRVNNGFYTPVT